MTPLASPVVVMMAKHDNKIEEHIDSDNANVVSILNRKFGSDSSSSGTTTTNIENNTKDVKSGIKLTSMQLAATAAAFTLAFAPLNNADAAMSGGRMGGSFSSPRQSMSRSAPRSSSSYGRGYSRGYPSGYVSRPMTGYGVGYGYGGGYSPLVSPYAGAGVISVARGPSFFDLLFVGGFIFSASQIFLKSSTTDEWSSSSVDTLERGWSSSSSSSSALGSGSEVVQLSVALEVPDRDDRNSLLSVLGRLSQTARTDSRVGIQNLSSQVALEILRRRSSIVSATTSNKEFKNSNQTEREFNDRSIKERSKFESENVSQYGGIDYGSSSSTKSSSITAASKATMMVVTLILNIDGDSTKLNKINSISDVEQALQKIAANSKVDDCLQGAEILWTPEERTETLSVRDIIADYPELRAI
eukprot:CAMPEP_0170787978 /NCGR_PEP_ID=MMETSP0733-20121128/18637_1 /TAXON_ID=186038 /ORGANISM="Fragilariopsis kerguelensis, Strain L26-C5" /LENGTH=414 /DNA_ID=CAMNT_0011134353 /DNA_START=245 /DNA_END=1489 /DNA_ORIENTATION=-